MGEDFSRYQGLVCTLVGILSIPISREKKMGLGTINRLNFRMELEELSSFVSAVWRKVAENLNLFSSDG